MGQKGLKRLKGSLITNTMDSKFRKKAFFAALCVITALTMSSCTPSFPREKLPETVKEVCKAEYDMDVDVAVEGSTVGIYYPMAGLLDVGMGISKDAWDKISNLILIASRVVLSTDADIKFYCVVTQDARLPELQVVIIKYVDDVKHGMYRNISRNESFKRTLFSINLTPQAKKERSIEQVFKKLGVKDETGQKVMDEFFRSTPTKLSDIGYWRGKFYLKDVTLPEFLAAQISNRIKIDFRGEKKLNEFFDYKSSEASFIEAPGERHFLIKFKIQPQIAAGNAPDLNEKKIQDILEIANSVVRGYKFQDFDFMILEDQLENAKIRVNREKVYDFKRDKFPVQEIVQAPQGYFMQLNAQ